MLAARALALHAFVLTLASELPLLAAAGYRPQLCMREQPVSAESKQEQDGKSTSKGSDVFADPCTVVLPGLFCGVFRLPMAVRFEEVELASSTGGLSVGGDAGSAGSAGSASAAVAGAGVRPERVQDMVVSHLALQEQLAEASTGKRQEAQPKAVFVSVADVVQRLRRCGGHGEFHSLLAALSACLRAQLPGGRDKDATAAVTAHWQAAMQRQAAV